MNILHLPLGATSHVTTPADAAARPTSCEGYVTKRGHFRKSWRVRFLRLNGADLSVSYFDSKEVARTPGAVPKGSFYLSSVEKHEYFVGVLGAQEKPFGFKMVGHAPRKGYVELDIFVESLADLNKWLDVCQNALAAAKKLTRSGQSDAATTKSLFGFSPATSPQKQMKKLAATKEELLRQAIDEIESAKLIGREACQEIVVQGEKLDHVESELERVEGDLDFGDKLLRHMKRPMLHLFSHDTRDKPATSPAASPVKQSALSDAERATALGQSDGGLAMASARGDMNDIERLASLLGELEAQATLLNEEAVRGTAQVERVGDALAHINDRVQAQTKKADAAIRRA